jgi:hypothetical protein
MTTQHERWAELASGYQPAVIPTIAEQEAESGQGPLPGTAGAAPQAGLGPVPEPDPTEQLAIAGDSSHIDSGPDIEAGSSDAKHQHYWIHSITETIERGYFDFEAYSVVLVEDVPQQVFGLDDLRNRATLVCISSTSDDAEVVTAYFGKRDRIKGADATTAMPLAVGTSMDYRSRQEAWMVAKGGNMLLSIIEYHAEPTSGTLGETS